MPSFGPDAPLARLGVEALVVGWHVQEMTRVAMGFLIAPVVAAGITVGLTVWVGATPARKLMTQGSDLDPALPGTVFAWALIFAGLSTLLGALPAFQVLRRRRRITLRAHLIAGAALGMGPFFILAVLGIARAAADREVGEFLPSLVRLLGDAFVGSLAGSVAALVFFVISRRHELVQDDAVQHEVARLRKTDGI